MTPATLFATHTLTSFVRSPAAPVFARSQMGTATNLRFLETLRTLHPALGYWTRGSRPIIFRFGIFAVHPELRELRAFYHRVPFFMSPESLFLRDGLPTGERLVMTSCTPERAFNCLVSFANGALGDGCVWEGSILGWWEIAQRCLSIPTNAPANRSQLRRNPCAHWLIQPQCPIDLIFHRIQLYLNRAVSSRFTTGDRRSGVDSQPPAEFSGQGIDSCVLGGGDREHSLGCFTAPSP
ncbi:hypothetical protein C8J57DRAFT_1240465 [Mycena rebaudengoi]|nr:hypothetical protein C8J57DRAFT_1240465 [Mycena rebaudengoi]